METQEVAGQDQEMDVRLNVGGSDESTVVGSWLRGLQEAEGLQLVLNPSYRRHSERELVSLVREALGTRHDPSHLVAEVLAEGSGRLAHLRSA